MKRSLKKTIQWVAIVVSLIVLVPVAAVIVHFAYHGELGELFEGNSYELEPMDVIDLGGDFYLDRWQPSDTRTDFLSDETVDDPLLGITPAYLIGDVDGEKFDTRLLYTTVDALRDSDLGASQTFAEQLEKAVSPERGERYTHFTSDLLDQPICVGVDTKLGCIVIFFFEFREGVTCKSRTENALAEFVMVWPRDSVYLMD